MSVSAADPSYIGAGPKDTSFWAISVRNKGANPCFVGSTLDVALTTAEGKLNMTGSRTGGEIIYLEPPVPVYLVQLTTPVPRFSRMAGGEIDTRPCAVLPVTDMEISPGPGLGSVSVDPGPAGGWGTPCAGETYLAQLLPQDCCGGTLPATQTKIDASAVAHVGERFRFLVTIINQRPIHSMVAGTEDPPPEPLNWSPCPTYHQELQGVEGSFGTYRLNCGKVAPMPPYASASFEMYIDVPADAQPGPSVLSFGFDDTAYQETSINVWIEP